MVEDAPSNGQTRPLRLLHHPLQPKVTGVKGHDNDCRIYEVFVDGRVRMCVDLAVVVVLRRFEVLLDE